MNASSPIVRALLVTSVLLSALPTWAATTVTCASPVSANPQPTEYFVSLSEAPKHLVHVSIRLREGDGVRRVYMPVWNALYQVRNFATNVEQVRAQDAAGASVKVTNSTPSEWEIAAPAGCLVVSYDIHLNSPGPFGSTVDETHAFFNWAMVLMYSPSLRDRPVSIRLTDVPTAWELRDTHVVGAADPGKVEQATGRAGNYDELVDSPAELGTFRQAQFTQDGATYHVVVHADPGDYDMANINDVLAKITHAAVDWMHDRPYDEYTFLYHFPRGPAGGGMEHAHGTAIDLNAQSVAENPLLLARVSAHEFFHLWNVKRIRPQSLEPIDYQHEMDTRALWFSEGVTTTVSELLLAHSGLIDEADYLRQLSNEIAELQRRPARRWQSAEESSLNAWLEANAFYRSPERSISYYNKGEILGVLLDLRMRQLTGGRKSLRDLFQWMNEHYAKQHRYFADSAGVQEAAEAVTGHSFADFFRDYVAGTNEIPYDDFFQFAGLRLVSITKKYASAGFTTTANIGGAPEVTNVETNSNAQRAGIAPGTRVVAINGQPANAYLDAQIAQMPPGSVIRLELESRRGKREVQLELGARAEQSYELQDLPTVTAEQRTQRTVWIHGDDESGGAH